MEFFKRIKEEKLKAEVVAFGSTRRANLKADEDPNLNALLEAETKYVCIFGKSWDLHVKVALKTSLEENLKMIRDSIEFLIDNGKKVIFDAEHFFDGFKDNPTYAMKTLEVAQDSGAECIVLCDTNGGMLPHEVKEIVESVAGKIDTKLGIHAHNDSDCAVANSIVAVLSGVRHVQGTINGYGERCGNANLCSIIPNLKLKLGIDCISDENLKKLTEVSRYVSEIANLAHNHSMPYVGDYAFSHKGGVHISAVLKNPRTYEHIDPSLVGNKRRIVVSELSGRSTIIAKAKELGLDFKEEKAREIVKMIKELENQGYMFEGAEASFELLMKKALGKLKKFFEVEGFRVIVDYRNGKIYSEATVKVRVSDAQEHTASEGNGPVNALDNALRKALEKFYPKLKEMKLSDYKVRVLNEDKGTAAKVRVLIESSDGTANWGTVGVSENIIEASFIALIDSIVYKLMKDEEK